MKIGNKVSFSISTYPYERSGIIVGKKGAAYIVRVDYPSKFMLFYKKVKDLKGENNELTRIKSR